MKKVLARRLLDSRNLMGAGDESPSPEGVPHYVSFLRNLDTRENMIIGIRRMAQKRAVDYMRVEKSIVDVLLKTLDEDHKGYKGEFIDKLRIRLSDGANTERAYHSLLQNQRSSTDVQQAMPRLTCVIHALNTAIRGVSNLFNYKSSFKKSSCRIF